MEKGEEKVWTEIMIGGVNVKFPFKPYPSQLSMMSMIMKGLQKKNHCLLESPTGSGKSLALLCSALAWQEDIRKKQQAMMLENIGLLEEGDEEYEKGCCSDKTSGKEMKKVPTIWFGTRTHKQIAQITQELSRTAYKSTKMTILSSREHSCIHPVNTSNKNDGCRDLLKGKHIDLPGTKCAFYHNVHRLKNHDNLRNCGLTDAWDLEDFIKVGKRMNVCPYYSTRELKMGASIIFCPYNYLIDPGIRTQMSINLHEQVIILDEAHNIEDSSRAAASYSLNETNLANTTADLDHLISENIRIDQHQHLHLVCSKIGQWLENCVPSLKETGYETWSSVWLGTEFISQLCEWGITKDTLQRLQNSYQEAMDTTDEDVDEPPVLHSASQAVIGGLLTVFEYLFVGANKFAEDYRISVVRQMEYGPQQPRRTRDGWVAVSKRPSKHFIMNLHFWCLNPAVAFGEFNSCHSVILTSGTLSPMSSFSSELGIKFPIQLEAAHVIANSQVWVGSVGSGPSGHRLQATYQNTNSYEFQDELGKLVLQVCQIVPHGVLCFFSSYKMLEKLSERWRNTGLWYEILKCKEIACEPHGKYKSNFDEILDNFYENVAPPPDSGGLTGALFLAVCRGKASEGIDFSDNNARAVITVGIPFPNFKDKQVELKRNYNNIFSKSRGLLTGGDWYEIQAFRALNQALGRCIRHKNDWGALIIVDDRFCKNPARYCKGLSKWVRQKVNNFNNFDSVVQSLKSFCNLQITNSANEVTDKISSKQKKGESSESFYPIFNNYTPTIQKSMSQENKCEQFKSTNNNTKITQNEHIQNNDKISTVSTKQWENKTPEKLNKDIGSAKLNSCKVKNEHNTVEKTPNKASNVTVIPESPVIISDDDDFLPSISMSSKRKSLSEMVSQSAKKKCKVTLSFDRKNARTKSKLDDSKNDVLQNSKARSQQTHRAINKNKTKFAQCKTCDYDLFQSPSKADIKTIENTLDNFFPNDLNLTQVGRIQKHNLVLTRAESNGINLDCVWSKIDNVALQFYYCPGCENVVAFSKLGTHSSFHNSLFITSEIKLNI